MNQKVFIAFSIETAMDPEGVFTHFDPVDITKILKVQPVQTQSYDKAEKENPRSRKPGNPWCSSWIYRLGGTGELHFDHDTYLENLLDKFMNNFLEPKKNLILKIKEDYKAICCLEIYIFETDDFITSVYVSPSIMKSLVEISCPISVYTHSKSINDYARYQYKRMFQF